MCAAHQRLPAQSTRFAPRGGAYTPSHCSDELLPNLTSPPSARMAAFKTVAIAWA